MKGLSRSLALAGVLACAMVAVATAAAPKSGGTYQGTSASHHSMRIVVARDGKTGVLTYCGTFRVGFHIVHGHFGARLTIAGGLVTEFRVRGGWKTRTLAEGQIDLVLGCDGRPGPWSARLK